MENQDLLIQWLVAQVIHLRTKVQTLEVLSTDTLQTDPKTANQTLKKMNANMEKLIFKQVKDEFQLISLDADDFLKNQLEDI